MTTYLDETVNAWPETEKVVEGTGVTFNFKFHETEHVVRSQSKKHTYHKHYREPIERTVTVKLQKDSPAANGEFCNKCMHRGYNGTILSVKYGRVQYFGPKFCKCVSKYMIFDEEETSN